MKQAVRDIITIQHAHAVAAAEAIQYESWDNDFRAENLNRMASRLKEVKVDLSVLSTEDLDFLGFGKWTDEKDDPMRGLRLIPLYLFNHLKPGQKLKCIDGKTVVVQDENPYYPDPNSIDNDHRGGYLAYGVIPKAE